MIESKGGFTLKGRYVIKKTNSLTGEIISISDPIENLIMLADGLGVNLFLRRLANNLTYDCIITSAEIGTGSTAPANSDTDLVTPVLTGISPTSQTVGTSTCLISFFIPSASLANGTYTEFLLRCGTQAFARSLITPSYTKGTNEDTTVEYTITGSN